MNRRVLGVLVVGVTLLFGFLVLSVKNQAAPVALPADSATIDVARLNALLKQGDKSFVLINVHVPYAGEIPGTDLFIPFDRVSAYLDRLPKDKTTPLVVYCRSGAMSQIAVATLRELGFTRVYDVPGGMNAWQAAGYPLLRRP